MEKFLFIFIINDEQGNYVSHRVYEDWVDCMNAAIELQIKYKGEAHDEEITIKQLTLIESEPIQKAGE